MTLLSDSAFRLALSLITGGVGFLWVIHDLLFLARLRGADRRDPLVGDKRFGYAVGILVAVIGMVGTLRFNGVL